MSFIINSEVLVNSLLSQANLSNIFTPEFQFVRDRKWRFDLADRINKIAVEFEGGAFINGRHTRGAGFTKDCEKYNRATVEGWRVLRYPSSAAISKNFINDYLILTGRK